MLAGCQIQSQAWLNVRATRWPSTNRLIKKQLLLRAQALFLPLMVPFLPSPLEQTEKQPPEKTIFSCTHIPHIWMRTTCWEVKESKREMAAPMQEREGIQASCVTSYGCWVIMIFINCGRERSQLRQGLHFYCARHTQTDPQAKPDIWTSSTKPGEEKESKGSRYPGTTLTCLYFQVPISLVSFLDSIWVVTTAKPNRAFQQTIVFRFVLQNFLSDLLSAC